MITYWETGTFFTRLNEYQPKCWINSQELTNEEVEILISEYHVPRDFVMDALDTEQWHSVHYGAFGNHHFAQSDYYHLFPPDRNNPLTD